jgi:hypothetical protein
MGCPGTVSGDNTLLLEAVELLAARRARHGLTGTGWQCFRLTCLRAFLASATETVGWRNKNDMLLALLREWG